MKNMISVIRLVLQSQKDQGKVKELAYKFDNLFSYEKVDSPVKIPIIFLRGGVFSMEKIDSALEELYKTKKHLQKYSKLIDDLDEYQRRGRFNIHKLRVSEVARD